MSQRVCFKVNEPSTYRLKSKGTTKTEKHRRAKPNKDVDNKLILLL